ncbi:MFS transporter [Vitreoscilla sp. C1]|uniref:MFS transporter n=1 Tax=Vitreoscilla sp. (strain C1) TaxID=96942 RepID=UPI00148EB9EC|nr:MFS transporter [Vitreoscilla sp. C1]
METHDPPKSSPLWKVVFVLILGTFAMGNAKFSIIPLVPTIAADLQISNQAVLDSVFAYFWGGFAGAPILALLFRNWNKPKILALLSLWCFLGNILSSFAHNAETLYWLRWFSSIPHAAFMAFATLLICEIAPPQKRGLYLGIILLGISLSTLFVVPFNTLIGMQHGWEISFRFVALLDLLIFILVLDLLPKNLNPTISTTIAQQLSGLKNPQVWQLYVLGLCIITCATAAWSFGIATINHASPLNMPFKVTLLGILGLGFIIGQIIGGLAADKNVHAAIGINTAYTLLVLSCLIASLPNYHIGIMAIFLLSISFATINIMMQIRLLDFPSTSLYLIMCCFNACIQLGNFLGSWLSEVAQHSHQSTQTMMVYTLPLSLLALFIWWYLDHQRIKKPQSKFPSS